jgi:tRNA threonylcarbamoyladenosine biosynthesis protein TsaE
MAAGSDSPQDLLEFHSAAEEQTERLGEGLGPHLRPGALLALRGDLGSGKTCLVRGLARGLGSPDPVSSPTYTLAHEYRGRLPLHHLDAWMAARDAAFLAAGGEELLLGTGVAAIEWAGAVEAWLPQPRLEVELTHLGPQLRRLRWRALAGEDGGLGPLAEAWAWLVGLRGTIPDRSSLFTSLFPVNPTDRRPLAGQ